MSLPDSAHLPQCVPPTRPAVGGPTTLSNSSDSSNLASSNLTASSILAASSSASDWCNTATSPFLDTSSGSAPTHPPALFGSEHQVFLAAATAANTRRAYRSAIRHFLDWGGVLPADMTVVVRYLVAHADRLNPRTLALRLTALSRWHAHQGFADPAADSTVRKTLAGIARVHGSPARKARALAVHDLERIAAHLDRCDTLQAKRDNALLQIGYFGGFRRSELVSLACDHVTWEAQGIIITLPRSKTDQSGLGIRKALPLGSGPCCPTRALRAWLTAAGIAQGPLFRTLSRWDALGSAPLDAGSVNAILTRCARAAGLAQVPHLSSHSLRRGMATSAYRAGASLRDIKRQGGWRHDATVQGYIDDASQFDDNAAGDLLALLQQNR